MLQMLYVSGASREMSKADLDSILETSRINNQRDGITGMLLWADGVFIQVLEGEASAVHRLVTRIQGDKRHRNFMVVYQQRSDERVFADWSMGFKHLDPHCSAHKTVFGLSRAALAQRMADRDEGIFLETILAFGRDFFANADA